ncbi:hypothetical protein BH11ACT4_BH11ACT4_13740 [soil metagenome]
MTASEPILVPGESIAIWPEVKLGRAYTHMMEVQSRIEEWESLRPLRTKVVQVSAQEVWITLDVVVQPPIELLASAFGDAIHNLRAALDAVVWEMATYGGHRPPGEAAEKAVQFPLFDDPDKFKKWADKVGSLSSPLRSRLEAQQPYRRAATLATRGQVDTLLALHALDVTDKHRNSVAATGGVKNLANFSLSIRGDALKLDPDVRTKAPITSGSVLVKMTSTEDFELLEYDTGDITAHFDVPAFGGFAPVLEILGTMAGKVRATLDLLYGRDIDAHGDADTSVEFEFDAGRVIAIKENGPPPEGDGPSSSSTRSAPRRGGSGALSELAAQPQTLDQRAVTLDVDVLEVAQQASALADEQKQATT